MFKNALIFRVAQDWANDWFGPTGDTVAAWERAEQALARWRFAPCGATQPHASGWVPPRGQAHGALLEVVGGHWFARLMVETRLLPASVVRRRVEEKAAQLEQETGRRPGRRQQRDIKDEVTLELLPRAFTRQSAVSVWIDPRRRLLAVDASSAARADDVLHALAQSFDGFPVSAIHTEASPASWMTECLLSGEPPAVFTIDRDCELKASEDKACVRYARHALDTEEVRAHLKAGKQPTRLALTFASRLSFVLTDMFQIKRLEFVDGVLESPGEGDFGDDPFDGNAVLIAGEVGPLVDALIEALGGEVPVIAEPVAPQKGPGEAPNLAHGDPARPLPRDQAAETGDAPPWD